MKQLARATALALLLIPTFAYADAFYDTYQEGMALFRAKDYASARVQFQRAFDMRSDPIILFSIAQTYRLESNVNEALVYFRRFLAESKISQDLRREAEGYVADLDALEKAAADRLLRDAETGPKEPDGAPVTTPIPPMNRPVAGAPNMASKNDEGPAMRKPHVPMVSWICFGIGGAGVVSALILGKLGLDAESELKHNPMATPADADRVKRYQTAINVTWGTAGAAVITGVVLYFAAPSYRDSKTITLGALSNGGWAASVTGRF